jgi:hypothetical protein
MFCFFTCNLYRYTVKHDVPIYISRDVLDRFSVHPFGWQSSFHPRGGGGGADEQKKKKKRGGGYFHTPKVGGGLYKLNAVDP